MRDAVPRVPKLYGKLTAASPPPRPGTWQWRAFQQLTKLNIALYRRTGGRVGGSFDGAPALLLHHVGRRSGEERVTPLIFLRDGEDLVVVASMGGIPKHPAWFHNLRAAPETVVELGRERREVRARVAGAEEKARLWPRLVDMYPAYAAYQRRTERDIPVVVLEPR
jgi:F420H(2)-dependent quinone reductase